MLIRGTFLLLSTLFLAACQPTQELTELNWRAPNSVVEQQAKLEYASEIQMGDRAFVESVLLQVFDAQGTAAATYIRTDIYERPVFGGPCDPYSESDSSSSAAEFNNEKCVNQMDVIQPATSNPMRFSYTTKVCERLVADTARMASVRAKIFANNVWAAPDSASVTKLWNLFFNATPIDASVVDALLEISKASSGPDNAWKNIVFTVCSSPEWQVL